MANASSRCLASRLGLALLALEVIVVSDLVKGIYWSFVFTATGWQILPLFSQYGHRISTFRENRQKGSIFSAIMFLEFLPDLTETSH
jgi:hypothetical protein